jgi:YD repeat-containing protein
MSATERLSKSGAALERLLVAIGLVGLLPVVSFAADPVFDAKGFTPRREFLSQLPFEHVDPMTGNLLLTFTDITLPGNAGFDLRIQRTYNSKIYDLYGGPYSLGEDSWAGFGWTMHLGRVLNADPGPSDAGPIVEMPDGSRHQLFRHLDNRTGHYISREYWTYEDRDPDPILRLPNGIEYVFGHRVSVDGKQLLYVTTIRDPFANTIDITYAPSPAPAEAIDRIEQDLGSGRKRTVIFAFDPTLPDGTGGQVVAGSLRSMSLDGRMWRYVQKRMPELGYSLLMEVQPPIGPSWLYEYDEGGPLTSRWEISRLTTPGGGRVDYTFVPQAFYTGSTLIYTPSLETRVTSGRDIVSGTWRYQYLSPGPFASIETTVTSPCATRTAFTFKSIGPYTDEQPWGIGTMITKVVMDTSGQEFERETIDWIASDPISNFPESGNSFQTHVPLLNKRTVVRTGSTQTYVTTHTYKTGAYRVGRPDNFNDHGRPYLTVEDGEQTRKTRRTFFYGSSSDPSFASYIVDRLASERVTVAGEDFTKEYTYEADTGFRTSESIYGITTLYSRDAFGNVATSQDAKGNLTRFSYDWAVNSSIETPEWTLNREINPDGTVRSETRRGFTTSFQYDDLFRPTLTTPPLGNAIRTEYDNVGASFTRVTQGSSVLTTNLDGFGQPTSTLNSVGIKTTTSYDACGRLERQSYPFESVNVGTTFVWDALGRLTKRTNPDNSFAEATYTGIDVRVKDEENHVTKQNWLAFGDPSEGRLVSVMDAESKKTTYSYNAVGSLTSVTPPDNLPGRQWTYNDRNQLMVETHPENGTVRYSYDATGNVETREDAQWGLTRFAYDRNNRVRSIDRPGDAYDTVIDYDESDNRTVLRNAYVDSAFRYDAMNRLKRREDIANGRTFLSEFTYEDNGNLKNVDYASGGRAAYQYDSENRISMVTNGAGLKFAHTFTYHPSGAPIEFRAGNGLWHRFEYDANRYWVTTVNTGNIPRLTYTYDFLGNVKKITDNRGTGMKQTFDYDKVDRLRSADGPWGQLTFTYDGVGNRRTKTAGSATTQYNLDPSTLRLASTSGAEQETFSYDANGNVTGDASNSYGYNVHDLMETATTPTGSTTYRYDGDGQRTIRSSAADQAYFLHHPNGQLLSEFKEAAGGVEIVRDYVYAGSRLLASIKPAVLVVNPLSVTFGGVVDGQQPAAQNLSVSVLGGDGFAWQASASAPWIRLTPSSGVAPATASVSVDTTGLSAGVYEGAITVTATKATQSPRVVPVILALTATPEFTVLPSQASFTMVEGGPNPAGAQAYILYTGGDTATWTATSAASWLTLSSASGTTPALVSLSVNGNGLSSGTYNGTILVESSGTPGSPRTIDVEFVVQPPGGKSCSPGVWYCERFDGMPYGDLDGHNGWQVLPESVSGQVRPDPRGTGRVLVLDPPVPTVLKDQIDLQDHLIDGSDISLQVMARDVLPNSKSVAKIEFFTIPGLGWNKNKRAFGTLRFSTHLVYQYGPNISQNIVPLEEGRWYQVKVSYRGGMVEVFVDGVSRFSTTSGISFDSPIQALATTGWTRRGEASLDVLEIQTVSVTRVVAEPQSLAFTIPDGGTCEGPGERSALRPPSRTSLNSSTAKAKRLPVAFEPNRGQLAEGLQFVARGEHHDILLSHSEMILASRGATRDTVRVRFSGASSLTGEALDPLPGKTHYLRGKDPKRWVTDVPRFARVRYRGVKPGVDLVFHSEEAGAEHDWVVAPGADPGGIEMALESALSTQIDAEGDLVLRAASGAFRLRRPRIYQEFEGARRSVKGRYILRGRNRVGFAVDTYDRGRPLVIDPVLSYSSFLGGSIHDEGRRIALDQNGNIYVAGRTLSGDFPLTGTALDDSHGGRWDAFVAKLDPSGSTLLYATYLGGTEDDLVSGLAVNSAGELILAGTTSSQNLPTVGLASRPYAGGRTDGFMARLAPDGSAFLEFTHLGGTGVDAILGVGIDMEDAVYVTGSTTSTDFPIQGSSELLPPLQPSIGGNGTTQCTDAFGGSGPCSDAFVSKLKDGIVYSTYLGGSLVDEALDIAVALDGRVYIAGNTRSSDFPVLNRVTDYGNSFNAQVPFAAALYPDGSNLIYSTWLAPGYAGGGANAVAIDADGAAHVVGYSGYYFGIMVRPGAYQETFQGGDTDAFALKIPPSGRPLAYATFLGGGLEDAATDVVVDPQGTAHIVGQTDSFNFPDAACLRGFGGGKDAFIASLSATGAQLFQATYFGGNGDETAENVVFSPPGLSSAGKLHLTGTTWSADLPLVAPFQSQSQFEDVFLATLDLSAPLSPPAGTVLLEQPTYTSYELDGSVSLGVKRVCGSAGAISIDYGTAGGTALPDVNYAESTGMIAFGDGDTAPKVITVPIFDDQNLSCEPLTFSVSLDGGSVSPPGTWVGLSTAYVSIVDNTQLPTQRAQLTLQQSDGSPGPDWVASTDAPWLTLDSYSGTGPSTIWVTADRTDLVIGTYSANITFAAPAGGTLVVVPVTLDVVPGSGGAGGRAALARSRTSGKKGGQR